MSLLDDIKAKIDTNGDGKISADDLEALKGDGNEGVIDKLKNSADQNADGKLSFDDIKEFDLGGVINDLKGKFFG